MIKHFTTLILLVVTLTNVYAQRPTVDEYKMQQEQLKKTALLRELDSGVYFMDVGEHITADKKFTYVLENIKSVPSDLTFLFGKN
jgi:hypothetical protein